MPRGQNHWVIRILARAVGYGFAGALVCGAYGALLGFLTGGLLVDWISTWLFHSAPLLLAYSAGAGVGAVGSAGLGFILFAGAAPFSQPKSFGVGMARMSTFALLGMTVGPVGLMVLVIGAQITFPSGNQDISPTSILMRGGPLLLWCGQILGTLLGSKKRWGAVEEYFVEGTWLALKTGAGMGGLTLLAAFLTHGKSARWLDPYSLVGFGMALGAGLITSLFAMSCALLATLVLPSSLRQPGVVKNIWGGSLAGLIPLLVMVGSWHWPAVASLTKWALLDSYLTPERGVGWLPLFMPPVALAGGLVGLAAGSIGRWRRRAGADLPVKDARSGDGGGAG